MVGRSVTRVYGWQAIALSLLVGGSVLAQGPQNPAQETLKGAASLSASQQRAKADEHLGLMHSILKRVDRLLETARKEKDVIKLNCVNEKLTEIKGNLNIAERASNAMRSARNDAVERTHQFSKILVIYQKVVVLGQEAEQCVGEDIRYTGTTTIVTEVPGGLPDDPTYIEPPTPFIPRPLEASATF
jgi:hypothetical protein